jgi:hypothetical protein
MWSEPEPLDLSDPEHPRCPPGSVLWPIDLKTGEEAYVEPVESNQQVLTNALLAARWTGARRVAPGVLFWRKGMGEWDLPMTPDGKLAPWGEAAMQRQERVVRELMARVREQQRRAAAGEPLDMVEGVHCTYCPARASCSEHTAILKHVATGEIVLPGAAPLSQEQRVWLASRLAAAERFVKQWRSGLIADVKVNGEILLEDGNVWGGHPRKKTAILVEHALPILREELGDELAEHAVNRSLTNESVEEAVKESLQGKRGAAAIVRRIFAKLGAAGALVTDVSTQYGAHKPKGADLAMQDDVEDLD